MVFTPKGESRKLPNGATALDFAYDIHTNVGNQSIGAKINHKIESIFTPLMSGDQIEIITSQSSTPKPEWLEHVVTAKARQSIKNFLKKDNQNNIEIGQHIFEEKMKEFGITPSARLFRKVLPAYECTKKDEFYSNLGAGIINLNGIEKILRENAASKVLKFWTIQLATPLKLFGGGKKNAKAIVSADEPEFTIAQCCKPIPGDKVVGFKNLTTNKIDVHKTSCSVLTKLASQHGERITSIKWSSRKEMSYLSEISLRGIDRIGILMDVVQLITGEFNINIRELSVQSHDGIFEGKVSLYVRNTGDLNKIIDKIQKIKGVETVNRIVN
jgi:GTP pyrophosphokinase